MPDLREWIRERAGELGFDACGFAEADLPASDSRGLRRFVALERHGSMEWMETTLERRLSPRAMWPEAKSAVALGMNYAPESDPMASLGESGAGTVSAYARNRDYHDVIKGKLKHLAGGIASRSGAAVKVFVDTAPLMEKPLARQAGIGWLGKHSVLVSRRFGSWLFLGFVLTEARIEPDPPESDHCGNCRACLDACPTDAFPAPYQLDARKCISYLTIEHRGPIDFDLRAAMGNRIFGCDDCLAVCPWNKFARAGREAKLRAKQALNAPSLRALSRLDEEAFRKEFSGSPIKRIGRDRFIRNCLIAIGNSAEESLADCAEARLGDADSAVRGAAVWALSRLLGADALRGLAATRMAGEADETVLAEWRLALGPGGEGEGEASGAARRGGEARSVSAREAAMRSSGKRNASAEGGGEGLRLDRGGAARGAPR